MENRNYVLESSAERIRSGVAEINTNLRALGDQLADTNRAIAAMNAWAEAQAARAEKKERESAQRLSRRADYAYWIATVGMLIGFMAFAFSRP